MGDTKLPRLYASQQQQRGTRHKSKGSVLHDGVRITAAQHAQQEEEQDAAIEAMVGLVKSYTESVKRELLAVHQRCRMLEQEHMRCCTSTSKLHSQIDATRAAVKTCSAPLPLSSVQEQLDEKEATLQRLVEELQQLRAQAASARHAGQEALQEQGQHKAELEAEVAFSQAAMKQKAKEAKSVAAGLRRTQIAVARQHPHMNIMDIRAVASQPGDAEDEEEDYPRASSKAPPTQQSAAQGQGHVNDSSYTAVDGLPSVCRCDIQQAYNLSAQSQQGVVAAADSMQAPDDVGQEQACLLDDHVMLCLVLDRNKTNDNSEAG